MKFQNPALTVLGGLFCFVPALSILVYGLDDTPYTTIISVMVFSACVVAAGLNLDSFTAEEEEQKKTSLRAVAVAQPLSWLLAAGLLIEPGNRLACVGIILTAIVGAAIVYKNVRDVLMSRRSWS